MPPRGPTVEPGHLGEAGVGAHADRADHELAGDLAPVGQADPDVGDLGDGDAGLDPHAVLDELAPATRIAISESSGVQHLVGGLDDRDRDARVAEVLGRLEADEAGADHDADDGRAADGAEEVLGVLDGAQHLHPVEAGDRRPHRHRAGAQHELVERQLVLAAVGGGAHGHAVPGRVDADDLGADADVEAEALEQLLGRLQEQVVLVLDDAADVVRQAAVGVGDVTGPLDHHDLGPLVEAPEPGGRGHATGHPTHHHDPHRGIASVASGVLLGVVSAFVLIALLHGGPSPSTVSPRGYLRSWFVPSPLRPLPSHGVTDLPLGYDHLPTRLGVTLEVDDERRLTGVLTPVPALSERGAVPMAALVFLVDAVTGVPVDSDPDSWTFTSDLTVRAPLIPLPDEVRSTATILRQGARSSTSEAPILADGRVWGHCFAGFSRVPRRDGDPVKTPFDPAMLEPADGGRLRSTSRCGPPRGTGRSTPRPASSRSTSTPTC